MGYHWILKYFQIIRCGLELQKTFLLVLWRSTEHFFLIYSALQDVYSPNTLRLLGKTTRNYSPCKPEPKPSILQVNVIICRLQSKILTFLFSALKALILAAELQRIHGCFSYSEHCIDIWGGPTPEKHVFLKEFRADLNLLLPESISRYFLLGEGTSFKTAKGLCLISRMEVKLLIS